jgi:hypothetical protein
VGYHEDAQVWLYHSICTKGKSPKLHPWWEGPYGVITRINDMVYRIQRHPGMKMVVVVHLDQLAPYQGSARDKLP